MNFFRLAGMLAILFVITPAECAEAYFQVDAEVEPTISLTGGDGGSISDLLHLDFDRKNNQWVAGRTSIYVHTNYPKAIVFRLKDDPEFVRKAGDPRTKVKPHFWLAVRINDIGVEKAATKNPVFQPDEFLNDGKPKPLALTIAPYYSDEPAPMAGIYEAKVGLVVSHTAASF